MIEASSALVLSFVGLVALTVAVALYGVRCSVRGADSITPSRVAGMLGLWMAATAAVSLAGLTADFDSVPPPLMLVVVAGFALTAVFARGQLGTQVATNISVAGLVVFQGFRFPLELLMHRAYSEGLMPVQMSFEGRNLDIVTGISALLVGGIALLRRTEVSRVVAWVFNIGGIALLLNIVAIAISSLPLFAAFGPDQTNTWVGFFPFVWLPAIFVMFALFGHIVLTRRLLADGRTR